MTRIASLGMYDHPALRQANDAVWHAIATRLRDAGVMRVPDRLDRDRSLMQIWSDPDLLLAQTCGYPYMQKFQSRLRYVATICYDAPGCEGAFHRSRIIVHADAAGDTLDAFRGARAAINDRMSNTGMNLFRASIAPLAGRSSFFGSVIETGSHAASLSAVARGTADIAAIDCVTYAHLARHDPASTRNVRTVGWTDSSPGLPLVTGFNSSPREMRILRQVLGDVVGDPALREPLETLLIRDVELLGIRRYQPVLTTERRAIRAGYPELR